MNRRTILSLATLGLLHWILRPSLRATEMPILAKSYREGMEVTGLWMSEKLDGIRGIWDGETLKSRRGTPIHAPGWFVEGLPPFGVEGELWLGRGTFERLTSIVLDQTPGDGWKNVQFHIFELPDEHLLFQERIAKADAWLKQHPAPHLHLIPQTPCESKAHMDRFLSKVQSRQGEGLVLRDPKSCYEAGRSDSYLKVKTVLDAEGQVIGYREGKGKYTGKTGSLKLRLEDGTIFYLGSGLSDAMRENPPAIGTVVTFKYRGYTKNGKPRFASFYRIRQD